MLELDYVQTSKIVVDKLIKPLTFIKSECFINMLRLRKKNKKLVQIKVKPVLLPISPIS